MAAIVTWLTETGNGLTVLSSTKYDFSYGDPFAEVRRFESVRASFAIAFLRFVVKLRSRKGTLRGLIIFKIEHPTRNWDANLDTNVVIQHLPVFARMEHWIMFTMQPTVNRVQWEIIVQQKELLIQFHVLLEPFRRSRIFPNAEIVPKIKTAAKLNCPRH